MNSNTTAAAASSPPPPPPHRDEEEEEDVQDSEEDIDQQQPPGGPAATTSSSSAPIPTTKRIRTSDNNHPTTKMHNTRSDPKILSMIERAQAQVFGKLKLNEVKFEEKISKTRTHANPLSRKYMVPPKIPLMETWFTDPTKPLCVDVGCAAGKFGLLMAYGGEEIAPGFQGMNHLGLEIRDKLVARANIWAEGKNLAGRVRYVMANANTALEALLKDYPGPVRVVAVQFPDPHFKKKHHKRRVVNEAFLRAVYNVLDSSSPSYLFVQSDVEEAAAHMRDNIDLSGMFSRLPHEQYTPRDPCLDPRRVASCEGEEYWTKDGSRAIPGKSDYGDWRIAPNPMGAPTEREVQNIALGLPVYRAFYVKKI